MDSLGIFIAIISIINSGILAIVGWYISGVRTQFDEVNQEHKLLHERSSKLNERVHKVELAVVKIEQIEENQKHQYTVIDKKLDDLVRDIKKSNESFQQFITNYYRDKK